MIRASRDKTPMELILIVKPKDLSRTNPIVRCVLPSLCSSSFGDFHEVVFVGNIIQWLVTSIQEMGGFSKENLQIVQVVPHPKLQIACIFSSTCPCNITYLGMI